MDISEKIRNLPIWTKEISIKPLEGGITNLNFLVNHGPDKLVVRLGNDIPEHLVFRSNEINISKAAHEIGVSPRLVYSDKGVLVLEYIESKTLDYKGVQKNLRRIIPVIKKIHNEIPNKLSGQPSIFWVFYVIKYYANFLKVNDSHHIPIVDDLLIKSKKLEDLSSPREIVFGHNDFLAANFLDDGTKIWVVDWEYGGFNDPLFDIGGLASNNSFNVDQEKEILEMYYRTNLSKDLFIKYNAMKIASLLRETMWSMVSELTSKLDFDYADYTQENLNKFYQAYESL
jgi:thiamine kinase-like enzyme